MNSINLTSAAFTIKTLMVDPDYISSLLIIVLYSNRSNEKYYGTIVNM